MKCTGRLGTALITSVRSASSDTQDCHGAPSDYLIEIQASCKLRSSIAANYREASLLDQTLYFTDVYSL